MNEQYEITIGTAFGKRMPVELVERSETLSGVKMARIRLASGVDAWVKPTSLKREVKTERSRLDIYLAPQSSDPVVEPGMYEKDGTIYRVQKSKSSGNLYAKTLKPIGGQRLNENDQVVGWEFVYDPGSIRSLSASDRMTVEDARSFGIKYGVCCVCGITLVDAKSVAAGIGPVCGKRV